MIAIEARPAPASGEGTLFPAKAGDDIRSIVASIENFNFMTFLLYAPQTCCAVGQTVPLTCSAIKDIVKACRRLAIVAILDGLVTMMQNWMVAIIVGLFLLLAVLELRARGFGGPTSLSRGRMTVNFGSAMLTAAAALLIPFGTVTAALFAAQHNVGLFNILAAPLLVIFIAALLTRSFLGYWLHRAFHKFPLLWRIHRIHHSDPHFDISLGLRQHPLVLFVSLPIYVLSVILLGLPVWAVILVDILMLAAAFWEHVDAPLPKRLSRALGLVLITPNSHHIHHSSWQRQTNSNYGSGLVIWDRLFGTYLEPEHEIIERIGLGDADDLIADSLWKQLFLPFKPDR